MVKANHLIVVLMLVIAGLLAYGMFANQAQAPDLEPALAAGGGAAGSADETIAVPVLYQTGQEVLVLIRTGKVKRGGTDSTELHMVAYSFEQQRNARRQIKFNSARNIDSDFRFSYNIYESSRRDPLFPPNLREETPEEDE